jgi:hypothetical protein
MQLSSARSTIFRIVAVTLFALGGTYLVLVASLGAPSFWYVPCFYALPLLGVLWAWRPRVAAALSIGPLISVIALLSYLSGLSLAFAITGAIIALLCVIGAVKDVGSIRVPLAISLSFLCASFLADRIFTNKVRIRSYQVNIALDGNASWGAVGPEWSDDVKPIVLYRQVGDTYCYVAFKSKELRHQLAEKDGEAVQMQINIFKDFGTEHAYNVRSVDGMLLANGHRVVKDAERFGGQILGSSGSSSERCW